MRVYRQSTPKAHAVDDSRTAGGAQRASGELTEDQWLDLWAFGVSPDGLGLRPSFFWALSTAEFEAIKRVHDRKEQRWAFERAEFRNGHFSTDGIPWMPADFLGGSSREQRKAEDFHSRMEVDRLNKQLANMKAGDTYGVPDVFLQIARNQAAIKDKAQHRN